MNIEIACKAPVRRWQQRLADELCHCGHQVGLVTHGRKTLGFGVATALALEQRVFGPHPSLFDAMIRQAAEESAGDGRQADLTIALDGVSVDAASVVEPVFNGDRGESALLAMLMSGQAPRVGIQMLRRDQSRAGLVAACLAVEDRAVLSRALDQVLTRVVTLLLQAVRRLEAGPPPNLPRLVPVPSIRPSGRAVAHVARSFARKVVARVAGARRGPNHWRVGYRRRAAGMARDGGAGPPFTIIPDDGRRFYADPMPFEHEGRSYVFVEDFPYATGKGVIAVSQIDRSGTASPPRIVLEQGCHLSYPVIIRHRGEIYMMPEMSGARRVQLFRADPFPDRWVPDHILIDNIVAADATPVEHDGRWWMFATVSDDGGSSWDQLCLFHAPDLLGPWTPHADNPVLVDAGAARPAGAMWHEDGVLMRVAQDCRGGYGVGLAICRVDRLDAESFAQTVVARIGPPEGSGADGTHTLNRAGDLEVIDLRFSSACAAAPSPCPAVPPSPGRG